MEISKETSKNKIIILVRHGERIDRYGATPTIHKYDPELTEKGKNQAYEAGKIINNYLFNDLKLEKSTKIAVISSPFARALQTSLQLKSSLFEETESNSRTLYVDNNLSEYMNHNFSNNDPRSFLAIYNNNSILLNDLVNTKIEYTNTQELLPSGLETKENCLERMQKALRSNKDKFLNENDYEVIVMVSHGRPISKLNATLGYTGPNKWKEIEYCAGFIYNLNSEEELIFQTKLVPSLSIE